ncbi:hypothetical protein Tco_0457893 [Tanacetum coccineum]
MSTLKFADSHNMVAFLSKPTESEGFEQIVDFLNAHPIRTLRLANVEDIDCFSNSTIFENLTLMGPKTTAWNEFSSTMASAIICLATNQKFNFSKLIFDSMQLWYKTNLDKVKGAIPTDPQHTPTILHPSTSQPQKTQTPRELTRIDTEIPQSSGPTEHVADEAVYKERGDSLVRDASTASCLEAEQDSGNITKTRSKATLNEPSSPRTSSGSSLWCQETMGIQLLRLGLRMYLHNPMIHCSQEEVLDLKKNTSSQQIEITSLKRSVKKLEKKRKLRPHWLKRLYRVGATARVDSSKEEDVLGQDASKQGRSDNVDTLFSVAEVIKIAQVSTASEKVSSASATTTTADDLTLAQALADLKSTKPKAKRIAFREPAKVDANYQLAERLQAEEQEQFTIEEKATLFKELLEQIRKHFNMGGWKYKDLKSKDFDSIKELFDRSLKRQKVDEDKDIAELQSLMEVIPNEEDVTINAIPLAVKSLRIVNWKIHKEGKKSYYQIIRARYGSTRPVEDLDLVLWNDLKNMFEPHVEDIVWRNQQGYKVLEWKLYDSYGVHFLRMQSMQIYMLVEKRYLLTPPKITDMLNKKLQRSIVRIKSFLMLFGVIAALIDVNAAQSKLVLLENFNENYSECLRLLYKVNAAEGVNAASEEVSTAELVNMALPPRDQRHQYLRFEGLQYTDADIVDFETRCYMEAQGFCSGDRVCLLAELGGGYLRLEAHWCMSSFWSSLVLSDSKRVFLIRILLRLYLFQLGGARRACVKAVILCTWDYFPTAKRRWRLLDMVYTRLIACSIAGRSQASEKETPGDLTTGDRLSPKVKVFLIPVIGIKENVLRNEEDKEVYEN